MARVATPERVRALELRPDRITAFYAKVLDAGVMPLTAGGDHLTSLPVLRAIAAENPVGMLHFDSHTDLFHSYFGGMMYTHGTPFRRAVSRTYSTFFVTIFGNWNDIIFN